MKLEEEIVEVAGLLAKPAGASAKFADAKEVDATLIRDGRKPIPEFIELKQGAVNAKIADILKGDEAGQAAAAEVLKAEHGPKAVAQMERIEIVRGSGNVFRDLGVENPELRQLKVLLAAEIIKTLDSRKLTVRDAAAQTGIAAADFSRIRGVKLDRFTVDRLMTILSRLGQEVKVQLSIRARKKDDLQSATA